MTDTVGHSLPMADSGRHAYTLDVQQVQALFDAAKLPRSIRSITRYCKTQRLDGLTVDGPNGPEWRVTEASVTRAIEELKRVFGWPAMAGHSQPRPAMADQNLRDDLTETDAANTLPKPVSVGHSLPMADSPGQGRVEDRYVEQLETRIEEKDAVIGMLRGELAQRNDELGRRNERERETNILIRGLQNLVLRLQAGSPAAEVLDNDPTMTSNTVPSTVDRPQQA